MTRGDFLLLVLAIVIGSTVNLGVAKLLQDRAHVHKPLVFMPDVKQDILGKVVTLPGPEPGSAVGWYFDPTIEVALTQLDARSDDEDFRRTVFVDVATKHRDGQYLSGIMAVDYMRVGDKYHPYSLSNVTLHFVPAPKPVTPKVDDQPKTKPAQQAPGSGLK